MKRDMLKNIKISMLRAALTVGATSFAVIGGGVIYQVTSGDVVAVSYASTDDDYLLPESDSKYLTEDDLEDMADDSTILKFARNEIFARHGRRFNSKRLQEYFDECDWYDGTVDPDDFDDSVLNKYEKANIKLIQKLEKRLEKKASKASKEEYEEWYVSQLTGDKSGVYTMYMEEDTILTLEGAFGSGETRDEAEASKQEKCGISLPLAEDIEIIGQGGDDDDEYYPRDEFIEDFVGNFNGLGIIIRIADGEIVQIYLCS